MLTRKRKTAGGFHLLLMAAMNLGNLSCGDSQGKIASFSTPSQELQGDKPTRTLKFTSPLQLPIQADFYSAGSSAKDIVIISPGGSIPPASMAGLAKTIAQHRHQVFVVHYFQDLAVIPTQRNNAEKFAKALKENLAQIEGLTATEKLLFARPLPIFALGHSLGAATLGETIGNVQSPFDKVIAFGASSFIQLPATVNIPTRFFYGSHDQIVDQAKIAILGQKFATKPQSVEGLNHFCIIDSDSVGSGKLREKDAPTDLTHQQCQSRLADAIEVELTISEKQVEPRNARWDADLCSLMAEELQTLAKEQNLQFRAVGENFASDFLGSAQFILSKPSFEPINETQVMNFKTLRNQEDVACKFKSLAAVAKESGQGFENEPSCSSLYRQTFAAYAVAYGYGNKALGKVEQTDFESGISWIQSKTVVTPKADGPNLGITTLQTELDGVQRYAGMKYCKIPSMNRVFVD